MTFFPDPLEMSITALIFMILVYGFILFKAAHFIAEGSEMLLLIYGPGFIGGILLPIVLAIPDCIIIIVSGTHHGTLEKIEHEISVGVGCLFGTTISLLTLRYALSVFYGLRDLDENYISHNSKKKLTKVSLLNSGVQVLNEVPLTAKIMLASSLGYLIIQICHFLMEKKDEHDMSKEKFFVFSGMALAFGLFIVYCLLQYFNAKSGQIKRLEQEVLKREEWKNNLDRTLAKVDYQEYFFKKHDSNNNGYLDKNEMQEVLKDLGLVGERQTLQEVIELVDVGNEIDGDFGKKDGKISLNEFKQAINLWLSNSKNDKIENDPNNKIEEEELIEVNNNDKIIKKFSLHDNEEDEEEEKFMEMSDSQLIFKAVILIIIGTVLCTIFSEPTVEVISKISTKMKIHPFLVSFVISPLILGSREIYSNIPLAKKKTSNSISVILYQINGLVTMNNTLCLGIFLAVIYFRSLPWIYSTEFLILLFIIFFVGLNSLQNKVRLIQAIFIILLYPISIVVVYNLKF